MSGNDFIWRFTPSRTEPQVLEEIFVQRQDMLADIVERVRESALTGNKHQILLIGPRGIGKTHFIALLHHRVTKDRALADKVRIAWLLEDETITSLVQLLKRIYEVLSEERPDEFPRDWLEGILDRSPASILKALEARLADKFRDKTLLLFVENLDLIFEGLGDEGQKQWRAFLQTHPFTSVVGTSQRIFKSVKSRQQPFFGFFATEHLRPLPAPDAVDLLRRIAHHRDQADLVAFLATPEGRSRVRAIHHLAGGNHRIYIVLSGFITRESLDELAGPFEKMADELTPYYQERMRWLSPQQRQIVEYLCAREGTCTPKEIARHLLSAENSIGSQLKKLLELGYVLRSPRGRESLYELAEPLMRLASEVKEKRHKPLRLLVNFLRVWYRPDALPKLLALAGTPSLRAHLQAAISQCRSTPDPLLKILDRESKLAKQENRLDDLCQVLEERAHTRGAAKDWAEFAFVQLLLNHPEAAVASCDRAVDVDPSWAHAWMVKGLALTRLDQYDAATECYDKALELNPRNGYALANKGMSLYFQGHYADAIKCCEEALDIDPRLDLALMMKGAALHELGRRGAAVKHYDKALMIDPKNAVALFRKAEALRELGRYDLAIECYSKSLAIDPGKPGPWALKAAALRETGRNEEADECLGKALELDANCHLLWFLKASLLDDLFRFADAIECYDHGLDIYPKDGSAWVGKGKVLSKLRRCEAAIECFDEALKIDPANADFWTQKGHTLVRLGRVDEARGCYERVLQLRSSRPTWAFYRCEAKFGLRQWRAGLVALRKALQRYPRDVRIDFTGIFDIMLRLMEEHGDLRRNLLTLISVVSQADATQDLGSSLVLSLVLMSPNQFDVKTLLAWRDAWLELGAGHAELEIPLRIFRVGVEYLIRGDEKVLLDLVSVERKILLQALRLDGPDGVGNASEVEF
jgi:tetratricopeptide (TPR) repeat protein/DNA-binding MarR family transcriptional regulator